MGVGVAIADPKNMRLLSLAVQPSAEFARRSAALETRDNTFATLQNEARLCKSSSKSFTSFMDYPYIVAILECWHEIVESYGPRSITFATDRLPAIAGIAKRIGVLTGFSYTAGIWEEDMIQGLCWKPVYPVFPSGASGVYIALRWSWASAVLSGNKHLTHLPRIHPRKFRELAVAKDAEIALTDVVCADNDKFLRLQSGSLTVEGRCFTRSYKTLEDINDTDNRFSEYGFSVGGGFHSVFLAKIWTIGAVQEAEASYASIMLRLDLTWMTTSGMKGKAIILILEKSDEESTEYTRVGLATISMGE